MNHVEKSQENIDFILIQYFFRKGSNCQVFKDIHEKKGYIDTNSLIFIGAKHDVSYIIIFQKAHSIHIRSHRLGLKNCTLIHGDFSCLTPTTRYQL